jgi:hypothetical protein
VYLIVKLLTFYDKGRFQQDFPLIFPQPKSQFLGFFEIANPRQLKK